MIESKVRTAQYLRDFPELSEHLNILEKKGQGTFASVFSVQAKHDKESKRIYALKMLIPTVDVRRIENEVRILRRLGGSYHVIKMHTAWRVRDHVFILMPFISYVPFGEYYLTADETEVIRYMRCLLQALAYIHKYRIIHRDVKPTNFLIDQHTRRMYLVDFGLAHSEAYGDVDERWELDCDSYDNKDSRLPASSNNRCSKRNHPSESEKPAKTPKLTDHTSPIASFNLPGEIRGRISPGIAGRSPHSESRSIYRATQNNFPPKLNMSHIQTTQAAAPPIPGNCVCAFRLTVCRVCRQLPRLNAARRGGTLGFRPPEVMMRHVDQTTAVDVWAAGVIFLSFLSGRYPFIKVDDDLDVLHAFTHLLGYERMQACAKTLGRRLLVDPKPPPMNTVDTPCMWLKARCIAIRRHEKKFIGLPPLLSKAVDKENQSPGSQGTEAKNSTSQFALPASHVFPTAAYDLLARLLEPNPNKRISASDALRHSFLHLTKTNTPVTGAHATKVGSVAPARSRAARKDDESVFRLRAQFC
ncbi:hypothetical protein T265_04795 [Opisthorchis viverrini]|uniref:non-specific serine/threonine protein kinase n=1 Tax=Opisthorchis viverrini TaxID=6198 RepID=A0A075AG31_OPIVI|nr:hypothetical protein T265_04795 [Opisthorchis viverrini]KER28334.1 hypothetical protein T265_04795 [Opisthorchis viverrini]